MRCLLDTHIFLWWLENDKRLKKSSRRVIEDPKNQIFASVANAWEISIKQKVGKLPLKTTIHECFKKSGFEIVPITLGHVLLLDTLPLHHKDPFDRILISQAKTENLVLITDDEKMAKYKIRTFK